jgi:cytochrome c-type biogenesis protein CcmH
MALFWILASLMTVLALAFVLVPLMRARAAVGGPSAREANLEALRAQRREIDADVANGTLAPATRDEALAELVDRAAEDLAGRSDEAPAAVKKPWVTAAVVSVVLPAIAFGTYLTLGAPAAIDARVAAPASAQQPDDKQIVAMVESLAAKVRERPDDAQGWGLLARSMSALGRFKESAEAYAHLATLAPKDPQVLADYADALGMAQGKTLTGKPFELARAALAIDPRHKKALALAGTASMHAQDYRAALGYWEALAAELPPGSEDEAQVRAIMEEVRGKAAAAGKPLAAAKAIAQAPAAAAPAQSVSGTVSISPAMAAKVAPGDTLFVFARAEGGGRMPLAVLRRTAGELPMRFTLDDSMAMTPASRISGAPAVRIEARVSRSGNAVPQPGDLVGASAVVAPGARDLAIMIDKVVP